MVSIATDYMFEGSEKPKAREYLANHEAFAVTAAPTAVTGETIAAPAEEKKKEGGEVKTSHGNCFSRSVVR